MKISKRGKDLAMRLPAKLVRELDIKPGDDIDVEFVRQPDGKFVGTVRKADGAAPAGA